MTLTKLHDPAAGTMRVAGFMSGSGSNLRRIIERQAPSYSVVVVFSDNAAGAAPAIGKDFDVPVVVRDIGAYYRARGRPRRDMEVRREFDRDTLRALAPFGVHAVALAGYMSVVTEELLGRVLAVNVHPADLSVTTEAGARAYRGAHAVADAIAAGERFLRSTTHIVEPGVDEGRLLMRSAPVEVAVPAGRDRVAHLAEVAAFNQERLKERGDWDIFPRTVRCIAEGRFSRDGEGRVHFDGLPVPLGVDAGDVA